MYHLCHPGVGWQKWSVGQYVCLFTMAYRKPSWPIRKGFSRVILIEKLFSAPPSQAGNISRSIERPNWWYYLVFHFSNVTRVEMRDASSPVAVNALSPCANLKWMPARSYNVPCYYLSLIRVTIPNYSVLSAFVVTFPFYSLPLLLFNTVPPSVSWLLPL